MTKQVVHWRESQLTDVCAKLIIYQAFIEGDIDLPKHLASPVHKLYFNPNMMSSLREPCGASRTP
jgi:hypothetical protein